MFNRECITVACELRSSLCLFFILRRNTHNAVKQTAALCLLKLLRVNPKAIPIDQHAAKIVQLINDKHLVSKPA